MNSLKLVLLLLAIFMASAARKGTPHKASCNHDKHALPLTFADVPVANYNNEVESSPDGGDGTHNKKDRSTGNRNLQQTYSNLRVAPIYSTLTMGDAAFKNYIQTELVPSVINYLQKLLKVKYPVVGNLVLPSYYTTVCGLTTPSTLLSGGYAADLALLITAFNDTQTSTIAYASPCVLQTTYSRPIVGMISFNLAAVVNPYGDALIHENNIQTTLHEITHVLGFSSGLFSYFRDANGNKRTGHMLTRTINGVSVGVLNVEPLTTKLRAHFGCSTLEGAVMENQGGSGSAGSHFERRIFGYEYMTSSIVPDMRISEFSLALLEGSGWYIPDYTMSEPMLWGKGKGCTFVTGACQSSGKPLFEEFCQAGNFGCSATGRAAVTCSGYDTFADGCSWYVPYSYNDCEDPTSVDYAMLPGKETYGAGTGSRCFTGNLAQGYSFTGTYGYCFKFTCQGSGTSTVLNVQVGTTTAVCKTAGSITVTGLTGKLTCPDPVKYCSTIGQPFCKRGCMGNGVCVSGKCQCSSGWGGLDCGDKL